MNSPFQNHARVPLARNIYDLTDDERENQILHFFKSIPQSLSICATPFVECPNELKLQLSGIKEKKTSMRECLLQEEKARECVQLQFAEPQHSTDTCKLTSGRIATCFFDTNPHQFCGVQCACLVPSIAGKGEPYSLKFKILLNTIPLKRIVLSLPRLPTTRKTNPIEWLYSTQLLLIPTIAS